MIRGTQTQGCLRELNMEYGSGWYIDEKREREVKVLWGKQVGSDCVSDIHRL